MNTDKAISICESMEWYDDFLNDDWIADVGARIARNEDLYDLWIDLLYDWRGGDLVAKGPRTFCRGLAAFIVGANVKYGKGLEANSIISVIIARLRDEMPFCFNRPDETKKLHSVLTLIHEQIQTEELRSESIIINQIWHEIIREPSMQITIHAQMKMAYLCVYNAYENFLVRYMARLTGEMVRVSDKKKFNEAVMSVFTGNLHELVWFQDDIKVHREVRNYLVHASGIVPVSGAWITSLDSYMINESDNRIQILPYNINILFRNLASAVEIIVNHCIARRHKV